MRRANGLQGHRRLHCFVGLGRFGGEGTTKGQNYQGAVILEQLMRRV
ncbi:hypothetical protein Q31a_27780 [Aureliella helgolandensis]|uniref:Uncharacterized protein n=1 Tax=Aureliella helgolandensis TaxID=2527968 RepID=A0A518G795_9BACT|nr:hypothetical protein Q31a_27780 [Aureliella helgolandensis]